MINNHFIVSMVKSAIRIIGGIIACICIRNGKIDVAVAVVAFVSVIIAEVIGVIEELVDPRK